MSLGSWLKSLFHKLNAQHIAGALAASQKMIDQIGAIEKWAWVPEFDTYINKAIPLLDAWKAGSPTTEIEEALTGAIGVVNSNLVGLSPNNKALIDVLVSTAETGLELLG